MATACVLAVATVLAGCTSGGGSPAAPPTPVGGATSSAGSKGPVSLTFAVYGEPVLVAAYRSIARDYESVHPRVHVDVRVSSSHERALERLDAWQARGATPDVFVADREDLPALMTEQTIQPVDELLSQRRIDFGDGYYREGLQGFSDQSRLQCMPTDVSADVVYYNPALVDLGRAFPGGVDPRSVAGMWDWETFAQVVRRSSTDAVRGVWVNPDLAGIAPFLWSAGNQLVDDTERPTSLTLAKATGTVEQLLAVLRNPRLSLAASGVQREAAVQQFRNGRLAMIVGNRSLTPVLGASGGPTFDLLPLPRFGDPRSIASVTGLCLSASTTRTEAAAAFIAYVVGNKGASTLAQTGYVVPSNVHVTHSGAFTPPGSVPVHSLVFDAAANNSSAPPISAEWPEVVAVTGPLIQGLLVDRVIDLETMLARIDAVSARIFAEGLPSSPSPSS